MGNIAVGGWFHDVTHNIFSLLRSSVILAIVGRMCLMLFFFHFNVEIYEAKFIMNPTIRAFHPD
jgi:hypothetical protein